MYEALTGFEFAVMMDYWRPVGGYLVVVVDLISALILLLMILITGLLGRLSKIRLGMLDLSRVWSFEVKRQINTC